MRVARALIPAFFYRGLIRAGLAFRLFGEGRSMKGGLRVFIGIGIFSGFRFARLALFAITGDSAKTNADERLPAKDGARRDNPENPIIPQILILTRSP